MKIRAN